MKQNRAYSSVMVKFCTIGFSLYSVDIRTTLLGSVCGRRPMECEEVRFKLYKKISGK
jgi:hypothetical protein